MDATNITLQNFTFSGGDDCVAIKPRSSNIHISNITCNGGNGIAIGSLGQYLEDSSVENVIIDNAKVPDTRFGTYIKTWVGELVPTDDYESGYVPRGGGWGVVRNITFSNIDVGDAQRAVVVTQDNGDDGTSKGTSKMEISAIRFENYTGILKSSNEVTVSCSKGILALILTLKALMFWRRMAKRLLGAVSGRQREVLLGYMIVKLWRRTIFMVLFTWIDITIL